MKKSQKSKVKSQNYKVKLKTFALCAVVLSFALCTLHFAPSAFAVYETEGAASSPLYLPNQIIVKYKPDQSPTDIQRAVTKRAARAQSFFGQIQNWREDVSLRLHRKEKPEEKLQKLLEVNQKAGAVKSKKVFRSRVLGPGLPPSLQNTYLYQTNGKVPVAEMVNLYQNQKEVEYAEPNYVYRLMNTPDDPHFGKLWGLKKIKAEEAWEETTGSDEVLAAVIDTGVDRNHEDLKGQVVNGGACGDSNGDSSPVSNYPESFHGTHVAGTIGAIGNNGIGVAGVNWKVKILAYRIQCGEGLSTSAGAWAIQDAADRGAKVANMSWGGYQSSRTLKNAVDYAVSKGLILVASAGNCGEGCPSRNCRAINQMNYPAAFDKVIAVASTGPQDKRSCFSNKNDYVELAAPGESILSTYPNNQYRSENGTSMSSPHVTGLVALMYAKNPNLTPAKVREILHTTAVDLGSSGRDPQFGFGRIDAAAALAATAGGGPTQTPTPTGSAPTATPTPTGPTTTVTPSPTGILGNGSFSLTPQTGNFRQGETFEVSVNADTGGQTSQAEITLDAVINFDKEILEVVSITPKEGNNVFEGSVYFSGGLPPGQTQKTLGKITFKAKKDGSVKVDFACTPGKTDDSNITLITPEGPVDILNCNKIVNGRYSILSHPCPTQALGGDYNCDGKVDEKDFSNPNTGENGKKGWKEDFLQNKTTLPFFEYFRRVFYH